jgi:hypothetical protein
MRRVVFGIALTIVAGSFVVLPATAAHASWVSTNCHVNNASDSHYRRLDAKAYAHVGVDEGYEFGGGCWNDNDRDDTPGQPDSGGEGPDCSGFTFKTWELKAAMGESGFQWWDRLQNIHGPYSSTSFHAPLQSWPFFKLPDKRYTTTMYMDAFAKQGHIGMLWGPSQPQDQTDSIVEAKGDSSGTGIFIEGFRFDSDYIAVRREAWTPDCWPNCGAPQGRPVPVP